MEGLSSAFQARSIIYQRGMACELLMRRVIFRGSDVGRSVARSIKATGLPKLSDQIIK